MVTLAKINVSTPGSGTGERGLHSAGVKINAVAAAVEAYVNGSGLTDSGHLGVVAPVNAAIANDDSLAIIANKLQGQIDNAPGAADIANVTLIANTAFNTASTATSAAQAAFNTASTATSAAQAANNAATAARTKADANETAIAANNVLATGAKNSIDGFIAGSELTTGGKLPALTPVLPTDPIANNDSAKTTAEKLQGQVDVLKSLFDAGAAWEAGTIYNTNDPANSTTDIFNFAPPDGALTFEGIVLDNATGGVRYVGYYVSDPAPTPQVVAGASMDIAEVAKILVIGTVQVSTATPPPPARLMTSVSDGFGNADSWRSINGLVSSVQEGNGYTFDGNQLLITRLMYGIVFGRALNYILPGATQTPDLALVKGSNFIDIDEYDSASGEIRHDLQVRYMGVLEVGDTFVIRSKVNYFQLIDADFEFGLMEIATVPGGPITGAQLPVLEIPLPTTVIAQNDLHELAIQKLQGQLNEITGTYDAGTAWVATTSYDEGPANTFNFVAPDGAIDASGLVLSNPSGATRFVGFYAGTGTINSGAAMDAAEVLKITVLGVTQQAANELAHDKVGIEAIVAGDNRPLEWNPTTAQVEAAEVPLKKYIGEYSLASIASIIGEYGQYALVDTSSPLAQQLLEWSGTEWLIKASSVGIYADVAALNALLPLADGFLAGNIATGTEWSVVGGAWTDTTVAVPLFTTLPVDDVAAGDTTIQFAPTVDLKLHYWNDAWVETGGNDDLIQRFPSTVDALGKPIPAGALIFIDNGGGIYRNSGTTTQPFTTNTFTGDFRRVDPSNVDPIPDWIGGLTYDTEDEVVATAPNGVTETAFNRYIISPNIDNFTAAAIMDAAEWGNYTVIGEYRQVGNIFRIENGGFPISLSSFDLQTSQEKLEFYIVPGVTQSFQASISPAIIFIHDSSGLITNVVDVAGTSKTFDVVTSSVAGATLSFYKDGSGYYIKIVNHDTTSAEFAQNSEMGYTLTPNNGDAVITDSNVAVGDVDRFKSTGIVLTAAGAWGALPIDSAGSHIVEVYVKSTQPLISVAWAGVNPSSFARVWDLVGNAINASVAVPTDSNVNVTVLEVSDKGAAGKYLKLQVITIDTGELRFGVYGPDTGAVAYPATYNIGVLKPEEPAIQFIPDVTLIDAVGNNNAFYSFAGGRTFAEVKQEFKELRFDINMSRFGVGNIRSGSIVIETAKLQEYLALNSYWIYQSGNDVSISVNQVADSHTGFTYRLANSDTPVGSNTWFKVTGIKNVQLLPPGTQLSEGGRIEIPVGDSSLVATAWSNTDLGFNPITTEGRLVIESSSLGNIEIELPMVSGRTYYGGVINSTPSWQIRARSQTGNNIGVATSFDASGGGTTILTRIWYYYPPRLAVKAEDLEITGGAGNQGDKLQSNGNGTASFVEDAPSSFTNHGNWHGVNLNTTVANGVIVGAGTGSPVNGANGAFTGACKITRIGDWVQQQFHSSNAPGTAVAEMFWRDSFDGGATWSAWVGQ